MATPGTGPTFGTRAAVWVPRHRKKPDAGSFLFTLMGLKMCLVDWQNILRTELSMLENRALGKGIHGIKSIYVKMPGIMFIFI